MGRRLNILETLLRLSMCLVLVAGSSIMLCDDLVNRGMDRTAFKKAEVFGTVKSLMKDYHSCFRSNFTRKLFLTRGISYNMTACVGDGNPDQICNDPTYLAEYYNCVFKQSASMYVTVNVTAEEEMKLKSFWKCLKDNFKRFEESYLGKR